METKIYEVVIFNETCKIREEDYDFIEKKLMQTIIGSTFPVHIESTKKENGYMIITCADEGTKNWLLHIGKIDVEVICNKTNCRPPPIRFDDIASIDHNNTKQVRPEMNTFRRLLNNLHIRKTDVKCNNNCQAPQTSNSNLLKINHTCRQLLTYQINESNFFKQFTLLQFQITMSGNPVFTMLKKQNINITTKQWLILAEKRFCDEDIQYDKATKRFCLYLIRVDAETIKYLEKHNWELFYGLSKIRLEEYDDSSFGKDALEKVPHLQSYNWDIHKYSKKDKYPSIHSTD